MKFFSTMIALPLMIVLFSVGCAVRQPAQPIADFTPAMFNSKDYVAAVDNFLIILDASSSMDTNYMGNQKFAIAVQIVNRMGQTLPELDQNAGLRSFEHSPEVSDKQTVLFYGMENYTQKGLNEKTGLISSPGGTSPMHKAITEAGQDLAGLSGKTAVIILSDGQARVGLEFPVTLEAAQTLKDQLGSDFCFYPIIVGDDKDGVALMDEIARIGKCGFASNADSLLVGSGMTPFVKKVFLTEKPMAPKAQKIVPPMPDVWIIDEAYFDFDKVAVKPGAFDFLNKIAGFLKNNPKAFVKIQGHTDSVGTKAYNDVLSLQRAQAVRAYLMDKGVDENRMSCEGFGFSKPASSDKTEKGRALNRRVKIYPIK